LCGNNFKGESDIYMTKTIMIDDYFRHYDGYGFICMKCGDMVKTAYRIKREKAYLIKGNTELIWLCEKCFNKHIRKRKEKVMFT